MLIKAFERFEELLNERFTMKVYTTEDSVRYTFYAALTERTTILPHNVVLELPHNAIEGAEVDTYISGNNGDKYVIEFKYYRQIPSGQNANRTQLAGRLIKDLSRLACFKPQEEDRKLVRLFVYVSDQEMNSYLSNEQNGLCSIYYLSRGECHLINDQLLAKRSKIFIESCGDITEMTIRTELASELSDDHYLRIWSVSPNGALTL
ncbi:MAG: hypothetical protein V3V99_08680 [candidate division Zixibacteria bacterium]